MSLRYTGEATMDEPALRDIERWRDKIEVRLDNRQVFFLFFGSAMVACMLFVLGVLVGKRLESRGRAEAPTTEDPLAALDRFGAAPVATAPAPLTFPRALIGGTSPKAGATPSERGHRAEHAEPKGTLTASTVSPAAPIGTTTATTTATTAATATTTVAARTPATVKTPATAKAPATGMPATTPATGNVPATGKLAALPRGFGPAAPQPRSTSATAAGGAIPREGSSAVKPQPVGAVAAKAPAAASASKAKGRYLLQLSSFQDRVEADAFARRFADRSAYVVSTEIPGKGTWYRVRVGSYVTMQDATAAKGAFEREHNVIAYVAGGGPPK
jgi:DedD protein